MKTRIIQTEPAHPTPVVADETGRPGFRGWVRRHRLASFFVLAFVLAWWSWPLDAFDIWPRQTFNAVGALLAAIVVIAVAEGRPGFADLGRRMIRWRVPWYFWAFALLMPLAVRFGTTLVNPGPTPDWSSMAWTSLALWFGVRMVNPLDGPLAEEPSFRGFAVPRMQTTWSPLRSAVVLGALVALWHLPLAAGTGLTGVATTLATTFVITLVYVWLFNRTGGSVLLVLVFHVAQGVITLDDLGYTGADLTRQQWLDCAAWTIVAVALLVLDRDAWRSAPAAAVYREGES
jgi:membrane protease YdiL (CAAX protease family)